MRNLGFSLHGEPMLIRNKAIISLYFLFTIVISTQLLLAATVNTLSAKAHQVGTNLTVLATASEAEAFQAARIQILIHLAHQHGGYTGATGGPFEIMVEDNIVYDHTGPAAGWGWHKIGIATSSKRGNTLYTDIASALLFSKTVNRTQIRSRILVRTLNPSWKVTATARTTCVLSYGRHPIPPIPEPSANDNAAAHSDRLSSAREQFAKITNYYCYYGGGDISRLAQYNAVILHAPEMSAHNVRKLDRLGVITLGYLSIGEASELIRGNGKGPGGYASWYFDKQQVGKPDENGNWHSYYANCNDPAWRSRCVRHASLLLRKDGYSGLFLDCVNTYELYPRTHDRAGTIKLIGELRKKFPNAVIVLNQGFKILPQVAPRIDGVMLESFTLGWRAMPNGQKSYCLRSASTLNWSLELIRDHIAPVLRRYPMKLLALDYALPNQRKQIQMAANRAATLGCLEAVAPIQLNRVYTLSVVGHPEEKWMHRVK